MFIISFLSLRTRFFLNFLGRHPSLSNKLVALESLKLLSIRFLEYFRLFLTLGCLNWHVYLLFSVSLSKICMNFIPELHALYSIISFQLCQAFFIFFLDSVCHFLFCLLVELSIITLFSISMKAFASLNATLCIILFFSLLSRIFFIFFFFFLTLA